MNLILKMQRFENLWRKKIKSWEKISTNNRKHFLKMIKAAEEAKVYLVT